MLQFTIKIAVIIFVFFAYNLSPAIAIAQESSLNLTITPSFFEYSLNGAKKISDRLRLRNNSTMPINLKISVNQLSALENGELDINSSNRDNSISWIKIQNQEVAAPPREWIDIPFVIDIPDYAAHGYYLAISISGEQINSMGNSVDLTGMAIAPVLINIKKENSKSSAELLEFKTNNFINEYLPIEFLTKIKNTGNLHIRPRGNIFISGQGNKDLAIIEVNEEAGAILPGGGREFKNFWNDGFIAYEVVEEDGEIIADKNGKPQKRLRINWNKLTNFRFGPYTANVFLVFDDGKKDITLEGTTTFWVVPYTLIIILIIISVSSVLLIRFAMKQHDKKVIEKYKRSHN